jgi:hypothetical protein
MMPLEGDDGERPAHGTLVSARLVNGRVRILVERVKRKGNTWEAWSPITSREYDSWADVPEEDIRALGEILFANLEATMS